jgi:hypothetical protein
MLPVSRRPAQEEHQVKGELMSTRVIMSKTVRGRLVQIVENQGALGYRYILYDGGVDKGQTNDLNYLVELYEKIW